MGSSLCVFKKYKAFIVVTLGNQFLHQAKCHTAYKVGHSKLTYKFKIQPLNLVTLHEKFFCDQIFIEYILKLYKKRKIDLPGKTDLLVIQSSCNIRVGHLE